MISEYEPTRSRAAVGEVITFFDVFVKSDLLCEFIGPNAPYIEF